MGRRSDHSRDDLRRLMLDAGDDLMAEVGLARFSAREVAKRVGYSVGTVANVWGGYDALVGAINSRTFVRWAADLRARLDDAGADRIAALVEGYFAFARANPNLWSAIYAHRLPPGQHLSVDDEEQRGELTAIIVAEVARALDHAPDAPVVALTRSLIATVHGHCDFTIAGSFALMGEDRPVEAALARVREALAAARAGL